MIFRLNWSLILQVNIVCPLYDQRTTPNEEDTEKFVIYHVKKEEYDTCHIMSAHPRILAQCDKPFSLRYFTISFRPFSPTPGALEFHPGKDYYFISTSSKTDLHRRVDGMCRSHNMRIVFKVAEKTLQQKDTTSTTSTAAAATTAATTMMWPTTEVYSYKNDDSKDIDNMVELGSLNDNDELDIVEDDDQQKKKKKRKRKKKQKKDKKEKKAEMEEETEREINATGQDEVDLLMNDTPPNQGPIL